MRNNKNFTFTYKDLILLKHRGEKLALKNIDSIIAILFYVILIFIGCKDNSKLHSVTLRVLVKNPSENQKVFITGNQPELGNWKPDSIMLGRVNDTIFSKTISFKEGTDLRFNITAGNKWLGALDSNEQLFKNFELDVKNDTTLSIIVYDWKNTFKDGIVVLNKKRFRPNRGTMVLDSLWKYHPGDNPEWAKEDFDDSNWKVVASYSYRGKDSNLNNENIGWYRFHFIADTSLWNKSLALLMGQLGASQIYYNEKLLYSFGEIGNSAESFKPSQVRVWKELKIDPKPEQLIVVRYANYNWKDQERLGFSPGFRIYLKDINTTFKQVSESVRDASYHQMVFTLIPLILFFLHIFIFSFNTKQNENLFYALCLLGFAGITYFNFEKFIETDPSLIILHYQLNGISVPFAIFFGLMTFYAMIYYNLPRRWKLYLLLFIFISVINFLLRSEATLINYIFFGIVNIDIIASSVFKKKNKKKLKGGLIVFTGFAVLAFFVVLQILLDYSVIPQLTEFNQVFVYGLIGFALSMSLFLSYNFSQINKDLETQLVKVKELSERTLEQERIANRLELERLIIESENERKTKELEDARKLQLSILPKSFPDMSHLEISANMRTATEVGGDYYDYYLSGDGTITLTIGDATGHGMKAGILVTLIKSLFDAMAHTYFIPDFFNHCTKTIKKMNLGNLYMGMTILKINEYKVTASAAGMPPFLIFRQSTNSVEEVVLKGMPLGAFLDYHYQQKILKVSPGDVILLLTDGFVELFNQNREMIDYNLVKKVFSDSAIKGPSGLIKDLLETADRWLNGYQQTDDITFLVIKVK